MTIPSSRDNPTRALSTADLAVASRQSPQVSPDPDEIEEVEGEQRPGERRGSELEREEVTRSLRGGDDSGVHRKRAATASDSQGTDDFSRDDDIGTAREARPVVEMENHRDDEMQSSSLRPGNLQGHSGSPGGPADARHR